MKKNSAYLVKEALAEINEITVDKAKEMTNDILFLDIREKEELLNVPSIENSIFIPRGLLEFYADEENPLYESKLNTKKDIIVYCAIGMRGALAAKTLKTMGYNNVYNLKGGLEEWNNNK